MKYLNFYKSVSKIAVEMIGAFIPLIIYQATGQLWHAFAYYFGYRILQFLITLPFKKLILKYPQIFLLIRSVPIVLNCVSILLLDVNLIVGIVGVTIFQALSNAFYELPAEIIYNYSSLKSDNTLQSKTVLAEKFGYIAAIVMGGLFLDYIPQYVLVVLSFVVYVISVVPLFIYYIKNKGKKNFNKDGISNAAITLNEKPAKSAEAKKISKSLIWSYSVTYCAYNCSGRINEFLNIWIFAKIGGQFAILGYLRAAYELSICVFMPLFAKISSKKDMTIPNIICFIYVAALCVSVPFLTNYMWLLFIMFIIYGACESISHTYCLENMRMKAKILGITNNALTARFLATQVGCGLPGLASLIHPLVGFGIMGAGALFCGIFMPINEERLRKRLVRYIQQ